MQGTCTIAGDGVASHPEVVLQRGLGRVRRDQRGLVVGLREDAAPIAEATPISAWHPPSAPASVALCLPR